MDFSAHLVDATKALATCGAKSALRDWDGAIDGAYRAMVALYDLRASLADEKLRAEQRAATSRNAS